MRIKDEEFIRGKVPMTKEEVRTVSLSKLDLESSDKLVDIGAGTGSVSVQAGTEISSGYIYSIEINSEACELIRQNADKFNIKNIDILEGDAVYKLKECPMDITKVFIGGSKGSLEIIFEELENFKELKRIVINSITTKTLNSAIEMLGKYGYEDIEIITLQINRAKAIKENYMLQAENMIYIISARKVRI